MVGGSEFAVVRGTELRFSDGQVVQVDTNNVAVAPVGDRMVEGDQGATCGTRDIGAAVERSSAAPRTAWIIVRCAPGKAAVLQFSLPDERAGFLARDLDGWRVVLVTAAADACRTASEIADICSSVAL